MKRCLNDCAGRQFQATPNMKLPRNLEFVSRLDLCTHLDNNARERKAWISVAIYFDHLGLFLSSFVEFSFLVCTSPFLFIFLLGKLNQDKWFVDPTWDFGRTKRTEHKIFRVLKSCQAFPWHNLRNKTESKFSPRLWGNTSFF